MRILSLGQALPDSTIDNYNWATALSFFDYDAVVVDPAVAVSEMVEGVTRDGLSYTSYDEEPIQNGPTTAEAIGLADLLYRRRDEVERLLARGGLVVCFAYPDVVHPRVAGFTGCHRYYWLPAPPGLTYGAELLKPAGGTHVVPTDFEHPFAEFFERHRAAVNYRAIFVEGAKGIGAVGRVIARSSGGAALAVEFQVGGGRVVFLPALSTRTGSGDRSRAASAIAIGVRNTLLLNAEGPAPDWISSQSLPGLAEAEARLAKAEQQVEKAESEIDEARNEFRSVDRYRRIVWQEGKYGLDLPVRDTLVLLGFANYTQPDEPGVISLEGNSIFLETEGSPEAVGMAPHYRLRERLEQSIAEGARRLGLIVINGYREMAPEARPQQYEDSLRVAAESMRYCVVESTKLLAAANLALRGDKDAVKAFRERLVATEGVFAGEVGLDEKAESK
jgi:hypothetical protein